MEVREARDELETWMKQELRLFLGFDNVDEICSYLLSLSDQDLEAYLQDFLGSSRKTLQFGRNVISRRKRLADLEANYAARLRSVDAIETETANGDKLIAYRKANCKPEPLVSRKEKKRQQKGSNSKSVDQACTKGRRKQLREDVLMEGRHMCSCQAAVHQLIRNCLQCGRIICEQEGDGPCLFCGTQKKQTLVDSGLVNAMQHKDKLLAYDRDLQSKTVVYDDQADYFSDMTDSWASADERKAARAAAAEKLLEKEEAKRKVIVSFDFAGRKIVSQEDESVNSQGKTSKPIASTSSQSKKKSLHSKDSMDKRPSQGSGAFQNPFVSFHPAYTPTEQVVPKKKPFRKEPPRSRVQHDYEIS